MEAYWLWLCCLEGLLRPWAGRLVEEFGNPREIFGAAKKALDAAVWLPPAQREAVLRGRRNWDKEKKIHELEKKGIKFISAEHPSYPQRLLELEDYPLGLFFKGRLPGEERKTAAVVGARKCSAYGREKAARLGALLGGRGVGVISGLALGVDGAAQRAALEAGGETFAVLGCGADICYPRENIALYDRIAREGGILTEYPPGQAPKAWHFPVRNRIISGLADCVVVVEAREKSGSLITAELAADQGREVWAVPGRMEDALSRGCNRLIAEGAGILWDEEELFRCLEMPSGEMQNTRNKNLGLEKKENMVYSGVDFHEKSLEAICRRLPLSRREIMEALVSLQLRGVIKETAKNYYVRVQAYTPLQGGNSWQNI